MKLPTQQTQTSSAGWAALLLAGVAWFALGLQLLLSLQLGIDHGKGWLGGLIAYLGYFTILSNAFIALVATAGWRLQRQSAVSTGLARLYSPLIVGCATAAMVLVGLIYHFILDKIWNPQGADWLANVLLHYATPALALLHWLLYRPLPSAAQRLPNWAPLAWCIYPLLYLAYALLRGLWLGEYPYPFVDANTLGYAQVAIKALGISVIFIALGYGIWGIQHWQLR